MSRCIDITDQRFGRLTAKYRKENNKWGGTRWHCECDCGNTTIVLMSHLRSGAIRSCGCLRRDLLTKPKIPWKPTLIEITCEVCGNKFTWYRPKGQGGWMPKICGRQDENGNFTPDPVCKQLRNVAYCQKAYDKNYRNGGQNLKAWAKEDTRKPAIKPEVKRYCTYRYEDGKKCGRVTGNNGFNYRYCDFHLAKLSNGCSGEYPNMEIM